MEERDENGDRQRQPLPLPGELDPDLIEVLYKGSILKNQEKQEKNGETRRYYREYKPSE